MTCREFMEAAESLTPSQLLRAVAEGQPLSAHVRECAACGRWLESQRSLGEALHTLQTVTAQREAGPAVEAAVLEAFRTRGFAPRVVAMPEATPPAMWRLSRFFEIGAYAAVAAALVVGLFLGARILQEKKTESATSQAQATSGSKTSQSALPVVNSGPAITPQVEEKTVPAAIASSSSPRSKASAQTPAKGETSASDQAGYVAVMLCDPLICSGDEQVVRMELPAAVSADGASAQPVLADVVIGEDGLIRAMRIVNE